MASVEEILNEIRIIESELEAIQGFEGDFPDYYDQLVADRDRLIAEYEGASAEASSSMEDDPRLGCFDPNDEVVVTDDGLPPEAYEGQDRCYEHPVAGIGDKVCLVDWETGEPGVPLTPEEEEEARRRREEERKAAEAAKEERDKAMFGHVSYVGTQQVPVDPYAIAPSQSFRGIEQDRGMTHFQVNKQIVSALEGVKQDVADRGGLLTSLGGFVGLGRVKTEARADTSFHYSGLAVDLYTLTATLDPAGAIPDAQRAQVGRDFVDQYIVQRDGVSEGPSQGWTWLVWCRSSLPQDEPALGVTTRTIQAVQFDGNTYRDDVRVTGRVFNLTEIFEKHGFQRIGGHYPYANKQPDKVKTQTPSFGNFGNMEWWHFQHTANLHPTRTLFGEVLLQTWTYEQLKNSNPWRFKNAVYNGMAFQK